MGEGTHLVEYVGASLVVECLDPVQVIVGYDVEDTEPEGLGTGRSHPVEHGVCASDLDPRGPGSGKHPLPGIHELGVSPCLGTFQAPGQGEVTVEVSGPSRVGTGHDPAS